MHDASRSDWLAGADDDSEFAVSSEQFASARDPHCDLRSLVAPSHHRRPEPFLGRPYHIWRHNLELARALNDHLASGASD